VQKILVAFVNLSERRRNQGGLMLRRLIESRQRFAGNEFGAAASVGIHLLLITAAVYVTTAKAITDADAEQPPPLVWVRTQPVTRTTSRVNHSQARSSAHRSVAAPASLSLDIRANIPDVNVELASVRNGEFGDGIKGPSTDAAPGGGAPSNENGAYDAYEVDTPAAAMANANVPVYPPALRAAGIEGRVVAQFVVDTQGKAARESIRILSSSNELFSESVRKAIAQMRFVPAKIRGKPVAQMVQQLFVFKLDR
jgi:protein TonB